MLGTFRLATTERWSEKVNSNRNVHVQGGTFELGKRWTGIRSSATSNADQKRTIKERRTKQQPYYAKQQWIAFEPERGYY